MQSKAASVSQYLASLPVERRSAIAAVREVILQNLDSDYREGMLSGMIVYYVPHSIYPAGYHCDPRQPLGFAGLASQKQYMSLYLMSVYCGRGGKETEHARWFRTAWLKSGKRLDMGKVCIRFNRLDDLPLDVIGEAIRRMPARAYISMYEKSRAAYAATKQPRPKKASSKKAAAQQSKAKSKAARA